MIFRDAIIAGFPSFRPSEVLPKSDTSSAWNYCVPQGNHGKHREMGMDVSIDDLNALRL